MYFSDADASELGPRFRSLSVHEYSMDVDGNRMDVDASGKPQRKSMEILNVARCASDGCRFVEHVGRCLLDSL